MVLPPRVRMDQPQHVTLIEPRPHVLAKDVADRPNLTRVPMVSHQPNRGRLADVDMEEEVEDVMKEDVMEDREDVIEDKEDVAEDKEDVAEDRDAPSHPGSVAMDPPPTLTGIEEPVNVRMEDEQNVLSPSVLLIFNKIHSHKK